MRFRQIVLLAAALLCAGSCGGGGGGGGDGGGGGGGSGLFSVRTVDPRSGTGSLPNDRPVTIFLSAQVDEASLSAATFSVVKLEDGAAHSGFFTVSTDKLRVTFTPDPWFETATTYRVTVTRDLLALDGRSLSREFEATFATGPWPSPKPVHQAQFLELPARMAIGRSSHTSTLLPSGFVLLAGGYRSGLAVTATAELFDPDRLEFIRTLNDLSEAKGNHTATLLGNGLVLVAGGERAGDFRGLRTADLFSPAALTFVATTSMREERSFHTATLLPDGRVLVTGGRTKDANGQTVWHRSAEIYDPTTEIWEPTANEMEMLRAGHRATLLPNGEVLISGGSGESSLEIFDPLTNRFRTLDARMTSPRSTHGSVLLPNGVVLLTDGGSRFGDLFDSATETILRTSNQTGVVRNAAVSFMFRPGEVLNLGGIDWDISFIHSTMDQYVQDYGPTGRYFSISAVPGHGVYLKDPRAFSAVSRLSDGRFLITGGLGPTFESDDLDTAVLFDPSIEK